MAKLLDKAENEMTTEDAALMAALNDEQLESLANEFAAMAILLRTEQVARFKRRGVAPPPVRLHLN